MDDQTLRSLLAFMQKAENLKNILRSAYTSQGRRESSAEHSWRLALLVLILSEFFTGTDSHKLLKLAVVHDLGEAISGDIPATEQSAVDGKSASELEAMRSLCACLPEDIRNELLDLWNEYEAGQTPEARIIKGLDKLETIMQHNQGQNPPDFNYAFNLHYGKQYMAYDSLLEQIRAVLDVDTNRRLREKG